MTKNKNINEELSEIKNIPSGQEFSNMLSIYKAVNGDEAYGYKHGYDRKKTKGWNNQGADSYGEVGYTHLKLSTAISMCAYGFDSIVQFKLLGGLKNYIFLDMDDPEIEKLQIKTYGKRLNLEGQLLEITGNPDIAKKYGGYTSPTTFGKTIHTRIWEEGYYIRGMVCDYWNEHGYIVVYPFKFSDMVTCAVATNVNSHMSVDEVKKRFTGVLGQSERDEQSKFIDIVPHLKVVGAFDPDGAQYIRVGGKIYSPYDSRKGANILVIDDENIVNPQDYKLFPDSVHLNEMPSNISTKGRFYFIMKGISWEGNVMGIDENGQQLTEDGSPIFKIKNGNQWFEWQYIEWMYENPDWVKENLLNSNLEFVAENNGIVNEAFRQGMSFDEFVNGNKAYGYVCIHQSSLKGILEHGFSREYAAENDSNYNGGRGFYGNGVYGCVIIGTNADPSKFSNIDMKNAGASRLSYYRDYSKPDGLKYGGVILKCSILGGWNRFLIFDKDLASKVYKGDYSIEHQVNEILGHKNPNAAKELINAMHCYEGFRYEVTDSDTRTTPPLAKLFRGSFSDFQKWETFFRKYGIRGAIYHGGNDGYGFVCYDYSEVVPVGISFDHGVTFVTDGIDWEKTHDRLTYAGDPSNKLGYMYKTVGSFPKKVSVDDTVFGCVSVEKNNGKWNCVRMDTLEELFPIDFDTEPTFSIRGVIDFVYKGYKFKGKLFNRSVDSPTFFYPDESTEFEINQIDAVIYYYIEGHGNEEQENNNDYQTIDDNVDKEELQESFFRFLDKMELL